jgi:hypothetical protein
MSVVMTAVITMDEGVSCGTVENVATADGR